MDPKVNDIMYHVEAQTESAIVTLDLHGRTKTWQFRLADGRRGTYRPSEPESTQWRLRPVGR